jgi:hypothetical protein
MAMTLTDAKTYVAKIIAGQADANILSAAGDAIVATYNKWSTLRDWTFLLRDTSEGFSVATCVIAGDGVTVTHATTGALNAVNKGATVTGYSGGSGTITVDTVTEGSTGVTAFTLSSAVTPGTATLAFSADIPVIASQQRYNLPTDFAKPYSARLLTLRIPLAYVKKREIHRKIYDHTVTGMPEAYTTFRPHTFNASSPHTHIDLFRIPNADDTLRLMYYRSFNPAATTLDIPDEYLYDFLDDARVRLLKVKAENDPRLAALMAETQLALSRIVEDDEVETEDEDLRLMSQMEMGGNRRAIYNDDWETRL